MKANKNNNINKAIYSILTLLICFICLITSCSSENGSNGNNANLVTPSNLVINTEIVGTSAINPNGDGSGVVNFTITATNATSYKILIGNQLIESTTGIFSHTFSQVGTNTHNITVSAYNGSQFTTGNKTLIVYKTIQLLWSDEFDTNGAPDSSKWGYDIGSNNGWSNNEVQNYTNRAENSFVSNGVLKIVTIKENYGGSSYTSARLKSQGKFSFKYGRIDIRAKLPTGGGTWPALWMLGENISSVSWPACGEIDIMEHLGNNLGQIHGSLHSPNNFGGNSNSGITTITNATTQFHVYSLDWSETSIKFYVDNNLYYNLTNTASLPFNSNFFFILNTAMGGWGGTIDPNFISSTFEIDYVRVYQ